MAILGLVLVAGASSLRAEVAVRTIAGRTEVMATSAPVAQVLAELARQAGMVVLYDGPAPRRLVTVSLSGPSPTELAQRFLEGQRLGYVMMGTEHAAGVRTLLVVGADGPGALEAGRSSPASDASSTPGRADESSEVPEDGAGEALFQPVVEDVLQAMRSSGSTGTMPAIVADPADPFALAPLLLTGVSTPSSRPPETGEGHGSGRLPAAIRRLLAPASESTSEADPSAPSRPGEPPRPTKPPF